MKDFTAPYYLSERLSEKMDEICQEFYDATLVAVGKMRSADTEASQLYPRDAKKRQKWLTSTYSAINSSLNNTIRRFNNLHRGQYLTAEYRGYKVRVPYYQFPLIYGDCFRSRSAYNQATERNSGKVLEALDRTFLTSVGNALKPNRNDPVTSNTLFFRLCGGYPFVTAYPNTYDKVGGKEYIKQETFYAGTALDNIKSIHTLAYRVNAYDLSTGQYFWASGLKSNNQFVPFTFDPLLDSGGKEITKGSGSSMMNYIYGKGVDPSKYVKVNGGGKENDLNPKEGGVK
jgi:hypothetical protein